MHALHAAQAYVTLLSEDKARAQAIGSLSLSKFELDVCM